MEELMKLLSILLPTYNRWCSFKKLVEYLDGENAFNNEDVEIIISDNGSTDETTSFVNGLKGKNLSVYVQSENKGLIGNLRFLSEVSSGKYLWFMGDNDIYEHGAIDKILKVIRSTGEMNIDHYFLNYCIYRGTETKPVYEGATGLYKDGAKAFFDVIRKSGSGALMFISANIFSRKCVETVNELTKDVENDNLALPLGYSVYCSKGSFYIFDKVYVKNEASSSSSWSGKETLVYSRDMIAMHDIIASNLKNYHEHREYIAKSGEYRFGEIKYLIKGRVFHKDNYYMKFLMKYYPLVIIRDFCVFPFWCLFYVNRMRKSKRYLK